MQVELPKIFFTYKAGTATRRDTRSNLIVHRVQFNFGQVGFYNMEVNRVGKPLFNQIVESTPWAKLSPTSDKIRSSTSVATDR